jgi:hypothetical protein
MSWNLRGGVPKAGKCAEKAAKEDDESAGVFRLFLSSRGRGAVRIARVDVVVVFGVLVGLGTVEDVVVVEASDGIELCERIVWRELGVERGRRIVYKPWQLRSVVAMVLKERKTEPRWPVFAHGCVKREERRGEEDGVRIESREAER